MKLSKKKTRLPLPTSVKRNGTNNRNGKREKEHIKKQSEQQDFLLTYLISSLIRRIHMKEISEL